MRIHYAQWHLDSVEPESVLLSLLKHVQMDAWIFMASKADVPDFAGLLGFEAQMVLREFDAGRLNTSWRPKGV